MVLQIRKIRLEKTFKVRTEDIYHQKQIRLRWTCYSNNENILYGAFNYAVTLLEQYGMTSGKVQTEDFLNKAQGLNYDNMHHNKLRFPLCGFIIQIANQVGPKSSVCFKFFNRH
jgi:hypothetical protein